ncbi:MAG: hypothetical protein LUO93_03130 [Methanomicrobiales archaeon]|nr:hypothetical protein [Methanomicrobiales archaeon]
MFQNEDVTGRKMDELSSLVPSTSFFSAFLSEFLQEKEVNKEVSVQKGKDFQHFRMKGIPTTFEDGFKGTKILMEDVTNERMQLTNLEFLARTSAALADMEEDDNIYQYIADRIADLAPESIIAISSVDSSTGTLVCEALADDYLYKGLTMGLGSPIIGDSFNLGRTPESLLYLAKEVLEEGPQRLYIQTVKKFPEVVCDELQERCLSEGITI